jgi:hypothetical protein
VSLKTWIGLASGLRLIIAARRNSYHPEKHYMRGPGPKWRAKHELQANSQRKPCLAIQ